MDSADIVLLLLIGTIKAFEVLLVDAKRMRATKKKLPELELELELELATPLDRFRTCIVKEKK